MAIAIQIPVIINPPAEPAEPVYTLEWQDFEIEDVNADLEVTAETQIDLAGVDIGGGIFFNVLDIAVDGNTVTINPDLLTEGMTVRIFYKQTGSLIALAQNQSSHNGGGEVIINGGII